MGFWVDLFVCYCSRGEQVKSRGTPTCHKEGPASIVNVLIGPGTWVRGRHEHHLMSIAYTQTAYEGLNLPNQDLNLPNWDLNLPNWDLNLSNQDFNLPNRRIES